MQEVFVSRADTSGVNHQQNITDLCCHNAGQIINYEPLHQSWAMEEVFAIIHYLTCQVFSLQQKKYIKFAKGSRQCKKIKTYGAENKLSE